MSDTVNRMLQHYGQSASTGQSKIDWRSDEAVIERARKYVATMPDAVSGENGSAKTFHVACVLKKGFELTNEQAMTLLAEYNQRCVPPWSDHELQHKLDDAAKASGGSGYLRNTKPERWDGVAIPEHVPKVNGHGNNGTNGSHAPRKKPEVSGPTRITLRDAVAASIEHSAGEKKSLINLGISDLNRAIGGGAEFGEMITIAARPSHGKSMLALQILDQLTKDGIECAMFSEEMNSLTLGKRALQFLSPLPESEWKRSKGKLQQEADVHFHRRAECKIIEGCRTAERVANEVRVLAAEGVKAVVVDYVQLLSSRGSRYETVTENSITLRKACSETGVLMIVLAQMSRGVESRDTFTPKPSDLRESGQLEQDADVLLFLVWPWKLHPDKSEKNEYLIFVSKNRNREIVSHCVKCTIDPSRQRVSGLSTEQDYGWTERL